MYISVCVSVYSVVAGLDKLLSRGLQIQKCYKKYCISTDVLQAVFTQVDGVIQSVSYNGSVGEITRIISTVTEAQESLQRRQSCLNTMHDQVAEIEALTLSIGEFDVESTDRRYDVLTFESPDKVIPFCPGGFKISFLIHALL